MANANRALWFTDWHMVSNDTEAGGVPQSVAGGMHPTDSTVLAAHANFLDPAVVMDGGDCKDHYGTDSGVTDEHDNYNTYVRNNANMHWGTVNADAGVTATKPILPGNHDQEWDSGDNTAGHDTSYITWGTKFWGAPYHWTMDWAAPKIRFIALHTTIIHITDPNIVSGTWSTGYEGWAKIAQTEVDFMVSIVDNLPTDYTAIILSHHPIASEGSGPGGGVRNDTGGASLYAAISARTAKIMCSINGHRHLAHNFVHSAAGITHINAPGVAYRLGDTTGRFNLIDYTPATRQILFTERKCPQFSDVASYDSTTTDGVAVTIQLPALGTTPPPPPTATVTQDNLVALGF